MVRDYLTRNTRVKVQSCSYVYDEGMQTDGFSIVCDAGGHVEVRFQSDRARSYAEAEIAALTDDEGTMSVMERSDYPSFPLRGIVEGYYGKPYSVQQRMDLIDFLAAHRMNAYFYAPKMDVFHRDRWREEFPEAQLREFSALSAHAKDRHVRFYYCIAPIDFGEEDDYERLREKLLRLTEIGICDFAVLFDDLPPSLTERADREGIAARHCEVVNFVNREIPHTHALVFCPTDYFQNTDTAYRRVVRERLDGDVQVFWTGYNTAAEAIPERDCIAASESFSRPLVLWDNYPVNDYAPKHRVYFGAVCNRTRAIARYHVGCLANPSELWETSKVALAAMAEWMWNAECYDDEAAYERAVNEQLGEGAEMRFFADLSRSSILRRYPEREPLFDRGDWAALDAIYELQAQSIEKARTSVRPALAAELQPLFAYAEEEVALYRVMRRGEDVEPHLKAMEALPLRTADQSLLRYIAKNGIGRNIELSERAVYWNTERKDES